MTALRNRPRPDHRIIKALPLHLADLEAQQVCSTCWELVDVVSVPLGSPADVPALVHRLWEDAYLPVAMAGAR